MRLGNEDDNGQPVHKIALVTGSRIVSKKNESSLKMKLAGLVRALDESEYFLITSCGDGVERLLIAQSDLFKYKKLIVVMPADSSGYMTVWGKNHLTGWAQDQVDSVMVARSEICFFIGRPDERMRKMIKFAENTSKKIKKLW